MKSEMFSFDLKDMSKGAVMAVISSFVLPIFAAVQTPDFNLFTTDWNQVLNLGLNGAFVGFVSYLGMQFMSDKNDKVFGKIG